jgi:hypothetical protein
MMEVINSYMTLLIYSPPLVIQCEEAVGYKVSIEMKQARGIAAHSTDCCPRLTKGTVCRSEVRCNVSRFWSRNIPDGSATRLWAVWPWNRGSISGKGKVRRFFPSARRPDRHWGPTGLPNIGYRDRDIPVKISTRLYLAAGLMLVDLYFHTHLHLHVWDPVPCHNHQSFNPFGYIHVGTWKIPSSRMWRRVAVVRIDVSEERIAPTIRVENNVSSN